MDPLSALKTVVVTAQAVAHLLQQAQLNKDSCKKLLSLVLAVIESLERAEARLLRYKIVNLPEFKRAVELLQAALETCKQLAKDCSEDPTSWWSKIYAEADRWYRADAYHERFLAATADVDRAWMVIDLVQLGLVSRSVQLQEEMAIGQAAIAANQDIALAGQDKLLAGQDTTHSLLRTLLQDVNSIKTFQADPSVIRLYETANEARALPDDDAASDTKVQALKKASEAVDQAGGVPRPRAFFIPQFSKDDIELMSDRR